MVTAATTILAVSPAIGLADTLVSPTESSRVVTHAAWLAGKRAAVARIRRDIALRDRAAMLARLAETA
jgi:hypothetical protein